MKHLSYGLLAAVMASGVAQANEMAPTASPCNFSGFYAGAALGYGSGKTSTKGEIRNGAAANTHDSREIKDLSMDGMHGGVFVGYGKEMGASRVYLGLELAYFMDGSVHKQNADNHLKKKDSFEAAARIGLAMNNAMPYLKFGWSNAKMDFKQAGGFIPAGTHVVVSPATKFNKRVNGFIVGAGVDVKLSRNLIAGLEYNYIAYGNAKKTVANGNSPLDADHYYKVTNKIRDNKFRLRIAYQF